jgi:hypothetical protein
MSGSIDVEPVNVAGSPTSTSPGVTDARAIGGRFCASTAGAHATTSACAKAAGERTGTASARRSELTTRTRIGEV